MCGDASPGLPILLVFAGQSNALGNNNNPVIIGSWATSGGDWYAEQGTEGYSTADWIVCEARVTDGDRYSAIVAMARRLIEFGRTVAPVQEAEGSTTLSNDWRPAPNAGAKGLAAKLDALVTVALAHVDYPIDPDADYRTIVVWWQGESDASNEAKSLAYEDVFGDEFVPFVEARAWCKHPHWYVFHLHTGGAGAFGENVRTAQTNVAAAYPSRMTLVSLEAETLQPDLLHYDAPTRVRQGIRLAGLMRNAGL